MSSVSIVFGVLLSALGGFLYSEATPNAEGVKSLTALIPAAFGVVLIVCGIIARNDKARKHAMHLAAMVGLIGCVMPLVRVLPKVFGSDPLSFADKGQLAMAGLCGVFVALCVKSFIDARKARKGAGK